VKNFLPLVRAFSGRFLSAAGVIALSIIVSRQLSLRDAGLFFEAFISLMGLAIAVQFGSPLVILRKVANLRAEPEETGAILTRTLSSISAICYIVALVWIGYFFVLRDFSTPLSWVWINILPAAAMGPLSSYLKAKGLPGRGGFWEVGVLSLVASGFVLLAMPSNAMAAWVVFSVACWIGMIAAMLQVGPRHFRSLFHPALDIRLITDGRFLWGMSILAYASLWGGVLISRWFLEEEATAVINGLFRTLAPLQFLILTVDYYTAPKFATTAGSKLRQLYTRARIMCFIMALPYVAATTILPSEVLVLLYGDKYASFGPELRIIILAMLFQITLGPAGMLLNMKNDDLVVLKCMAFKLLVYLLLGVLLVMQFKISGIIFALAASIVLQALVQYIVVFRKHLSA
tara:strand:+ start:6292 stop:7497 length:1206 start_codon:yes stop_codon:yes gene_type:complete